MNGSRLLVLVFLGLGLWAVVAGSAKALEGWRARNWPVAPGRVIVSQAYELRTSQKIRVARLCVKVDYLYMVAGTVYEGHRINTGWSCFGSEDRVKDLLQEYPSGAAVQVRYDPEDPERALLEPGLDWTVFFLWGVGLVTLSVAWPLLRRRG